MKNKKTDLITKEELENSFIGSNSKKEACAKLGISKPTYNKLLLKHDLLFPGTEIVNGIICKSCSHPEFNKEWIINNWVNTTKSLYEVAKENNVSLSLLESRVTKFRITKHFKYTMNYSKLLDSSDVDSCYLAGLIATDGYLNTNANFASIRLVGDSERKLLEDVLKCFSSNDTVTECRKGVYSIRIACEGYKKFLQDEFNIAIKNKTFETGFPLNFYNEDCAKAFILGCLDGDGCISHLNSGYPTVVLLSASEKFIDGLYDAVRKFTSVNITKRSEKRYFCIYVGGKANVSSFLDWVYSTSSSLRLDRKYLKYLQVKDIV